MNCKTAEIYINALFDDELSVKDSLGIIEHIENCGVCKTRWQLNEEARSKLKHFIGYISASENLRSKIYKSFSNKNKQRQPFYVKPILVTASVIFLLGLSLFFNNTYLAIPNLHTLHTTSTIQLISSDIEFLSRHLGINLKKEYFIAFEGAMLKPHGAIKLSRPFNRNIGLIALKNDKGQKVSLCFLPKDYHIVKSDKTEINGTVFHHGTKQNYNFAYWKQNERTIALISDSLTYMEMIDLAMPLVNKV